MHEAATCHPIAVICDAMEFRCGIPLPLRPGSTDDLILLPGSICPVRRDCIRAIPKTMGKLLVTRERARFSLCLLCLNDSDLDMATAPALNG